MKYLVLAVVLLLPCLVSAQQCTQAQLNTEFSTDPTSRTYATCEPGNDQCVLDKFNAPCTNHAACKVDQTVPREKIYEVIDKDELKALADVSLNDTTQTGSRFRRLLVAMNVLSFNMGEGKTRQKLFDIFPAPEAPITNAAIAALQQKDVPRSQVVCGRPGTLSDVSCGLRGQDCP